MKAHGGEKYMLEMRLQLGDACKAFFNLIKAGTSRREGHKKSEIPGFYTARSERSSIPFRQTQVMGFMGILYAYMLHSR